VDSRIKLIHPIFASEKSAETIASKKSQKYL